MQTDGWLELHGIQQAPSPNYNARPTDAQVNLLVLHNISLPPGQFGTGCARQLFLNTLDLNADPWFSNLSGLRVSAHFLIERDGTITQFVSCNDRAWHAGLSAFQGRDNCNDFSIGVELEGTDTIPYTDQQYLALAQLTAQLRSQYPLKHVRGHCHIAPSRKTDPGDSFDWSRYAKLGRWQSHQLPKGLTA
jgi:N-acetyl-anhydromuramoyl-L-alanine amidase